MQFKCPSCSKTLQIAQVQPGQKVKCPCGKIISLSTPNSSAASAAAPTPSGQILDCACGKKMRIPEKAFGKAVKCVCGQVHKIPAGGLSPSPAVVAAPSGAPTSSDPFGDDWLNDLPAESSHQSAMPMSPAATTPMNFAQQPTSTSGNSNSSAVANQYLSNASATLAKERADEERGEPWSFDAGQLLAGLGMMLGATVWFVLGLYAGRIFFYPPILFIMGIIAFVRGLMG